MCGAVRVDSSFRISLPVLQSMFDLDTGTFNTEDADIHFCPGGGSMIFYWFCDVNQAVVKPYGVVLKDGTVLEPKLPPFEECLGTKPYSGSIDNEPQYACVVTNLGNISRVKVERYNPLDDAMSLEISFITWEK